MKVTGDPAIVLKDVWIGDVWLLGGQSNMQMRLSQCDGGEAAVKRAESESRIRLFQVGGNLGDESPQTRLKKYEGWGVRDAEIASDFSGVGWFFGERLADELEVRIGLINVSLGGTPIEVWLSQSALDQQVKEHPELAAHFAELARVESDALALRELRLTEHRPSREKAIAYEQNMLLATELAAPELEDDEWDEIVMPGFWERSGIEELADFDGYVWLRKEVVLPEGWGDRDLKLEIGRTRDLDAVWFNGHHLGAIGSIEELYDLNRPRGVRPERESSVYNVPAKWVQEGENVVVIRIFNQQRVGGIIEDGKQELELRLVGVEEPPISLAGKWKYQLGPAFVTHWASYLFPTQPASMFNAYVSPIAGFPIRGILWYQGESNTKDHVEYYSDWMRALIVDWRGHWEDQELPFYLVQLPNISRGPKDNWARIREAQASVLDLPGTGMAVTLDVGQPNNIHPPEKKTVADRLARLALSRTYGLELVDQGPVFSGAEAEGSGLRLTFDHIGSGLRSMNGEKLENFEIAGEDRKFFPAEATIDGDTVLVSSPEVLSPVAVRYAYENNPTNINFYNEEGLPAAPFRSDDWSDR
nr:sialate O-acetylesterase [Puniceicoccus vermicola]